MYNAIEMNQGSNTIDSTPELFWLWLASVNVSLYTMLTRDSDDMRGFNLSTIHPRIKLVKRVLNKMKDML